MTSLNSDGERCTDSLYLLDSRCVHGSHDLEPAAIWKQIDKIMGSPEFRGSERMRRFLLFTVREMLAGRGEHLKEYTIAVQVFDRPDTFDPAADPIVRVEARRLREKLNRYYKDRGRS